MMDVKRAGSWEEYMANTMGADWDQRGKAEPATGALRFTGIYQQDGDSFVWIGEYESHYGDDLRELITNTPSARVWGDLEHNGMHLLAVTDRYGETLYYELPESV